MEWKEKIKKSCEWNDKIPKIFLVYSRTYIKKGSTMKKIPTFLTFFKYCIQKKRNENSMIRRS